MGQYPRPFLLGARNDDEAEPGATVWRSQPADAKLRGLTPSSRCADGSRLLAYRARCGAAASSFRAKSSAMPERVVRARARAPDPRFLPAADQRD